ncbi:MAG: c-type cytochrome [Ramlibacter sp.]
MKRWIWTLLLAGAALAGCSKDPKVDPVSGGNPQAGKLLLDRYGCAACHEIKGLAQARSQVGPSLKQIRDASYVAGVLPNSADNLEKWIMHPREIDPKTAMPELGVTRSEARDMAAYLYNQ